MQRTGLKGKIPIEMDVDMEIRINVTENIISIKDKNVFDQLKPLSETK